MVEGGYVSAYLERPLRTLRRACVETALRRGLERPVCEPCAIAHHCVLELRKLRRAQKKAMLAAERARG